jgi:sigma-B regulation protein RsbU (phosphoserine phosphatase)
LKQTVGVLKAVFDVGPLFSGLSVFPAHADEVSEVVSSDGRVLLRLGDPGFISSGKTLPRDLMARMQSVSPGWFFSEWNGEGAKLVGYATIEFLGIRHADGRVTGPASFVVVHKPASILLAPLIQRAVVLMAAGALIILIACALTMYFVSRNVLIPLETLRTAAAALAATTGKVPEGSKPGRMKNPEAALASVAAIRTGDEIEEFAGNFQIMSARLLRYQEDLRREIADKTAAIQSDLDLAREFQQAFLPRDYPKVPSESRSDPITLNFQHVYQAAQSVSGDFFDIIKFDDSRAGVLIADVMGHGTRSALVTAILRALLQGVARAGSDPSEFLRLLNRHFHDTMRQTDQLIFVSACFVVFDTHEETLRFASAGHPSPFLGNRKTGQVEPLHGPLKDNPALGLFPESEYHEFSRPLREGDVVLLYTDGIIEATDEAGDEYGRERLAVAMRRNLDMDLSGFTQAALESVRQFSGYRPLEDDLCVVAVEIGANGHATAHHRKAPHESLLEF